MSIEPIRLAVTVAASPERAFAIFTRQIGLWWPSRHTIGPSPFTDVVIEPSNGGRWFERNADGTETNWGHVMAWEPPHRLVLAWSIDSEFNYNPNLLTEVEFNFSPQADGTTVSMEHRQLERFGEFAAKRVAEQLRGGWPIVLQDFSVFADRAGKE